MTETNQNFLIVHTSWYEEHIDNMVFIASKELDFFQTRPLCVPGALELAAEAKRFLTNEEYKKSDIVNPANPVWDNVRGIIFCGIIMRGETSHYELVTRETFRSIGCLALEFPDIFMVNNVICVDNENQLAERLEKTTKNNARSLKNMCKGIRSRASAWEEVDPNDGGFS